MTEPLETQAASPASPAAPAETAAPLSASLSLAGHKQLAAALAAAQQTARSAKRAGHPAARSASPASNEEPISAAVQALAGSGLAFVPGSPYLAYIGGREPALILASQSVTLLHSTGDFVSLGEVYWPLSAGDGQDLPQRFAAAVAAGLACCLCDLLLLPRPEQPAEYQQPPAPPAPAAEPAPTSSKALTQPQPAFETGEEFEARVIAFAQALCDEGLMSAAAFELWSRQWSTLRKFSGEYKAWPQSSWQEFRRRCQALRTRLHEEREKGGGRHEPHHAFQ